MSKQIAGVNVNFNSDEIKSAKTPDDIVKTGMFDHLASNKEKIDAAKEVIKISKGGGEEKKDEKADSAPAIV